MTESFDPRGKSNRQTFRGPIGPKPYGRNRMGVQNDKLRTDRYDRIMIRVSISYPKGEGSTFDHDYYAATHIPLCKAAFSPSKTEIDKGLNGPNEAAVHFYFDSMDAMQAGFGSPKMGDVMADVANYTSIAPVMQVSEIVG
jgi:uncharacterized protein (TIGR02118 family)